MATNLGIYNGLFKDQGKDWFLIKSLRFSCNASQHDSRSRCFLFILYFLFFISINTFNTGCLLAKESLNNKNSNLSISPSQNGTNINTPDHFPDPNFRRAAEMFMSVSANGPFSALQASQKTGLFDCSNMGIRNLKGIEFFTQITQLNCYQNYLTELNLSFNSALKKVDCADNPTLVRLDLSGNPNLEEVECRRCNLGGLDISQNGKLKYLYCGANKLNYLDTSNNPELLRFDCAWNRVERLDLSKNKKLVTLFCAVNQLTELDLTQNPELFDLFAFENRITTIDLSTNRKLEIVDFRNNQIFNVSIFLLCPILQALDLRFNKLDFGDWSEIDTLKDRLGPAVHDPVYQYITKGFAYTPQADSFSLSEQANINLASSFPDPIFRQAIEQFMGVSKGQAFTALDAAQKTGILHLENKGIKSLRGIEFFVGVNQYLLSHNQITDIQALRNLHSLRYGKKIDVSYNHLSEDDLSDLLALHTQLKEGLAFSPQANPLLVEPIFWRQNQHYYMMVKIPLGFAQANQFIRGMFDGSGYLASITSEEENQFVTDHFSGYTVLLGGYQDPAVPEITNGDFKSNWRWVSGEPWNYTHWHAIEPNNFENLQEDYLHLYLNGTGTDIGFWNDGTDSLSTINMSGFLVEWDHNPFYSTLELPLRYTGRSQETLESIPYHIDEYEAAAVGLQLPLDPQQNIFDNGQFTPVSRKEKVLPGVNWISWPLWHNRNGEVFEARRIQLRFDLTVSPEKVSNLILYSPYYTDQPFFLGNTVPINDMFIAYLNGQRIGKFDSTHIRRYGETDLFAETGGWITDGTLGSQSTQYLRTGTNALDLIILEKWGGGGLGRVNLKALVSQDNPIEPTPTSTPTIPITPTFTATPTLPSSSNRVYFKGVSNLYRLGDTVSLEFIADVGQNPLGSYSIDITYDSAILSIENISAGNNKEFGAPVFSDSNKDHLILLDAQTTQIDGPTGEVSLAIVRFKVVGTTESTPISIRIVELLTANDLSTISAQPESGTIHFVSSTTPSPTETFTPSKTPTIEPTNTPLVTPTIFAPVPNYINTISEGSIDSNLIWIIEGTFASLNHALVSVTDILPSGASSIGAEGNALRVSVKPGEGSLILFGRTPIPATTKALVCATVWSNNQFPSVITGLIDTDPNGTLSGDGIGMDQMNVSRKANKTWKRITSLHDSQTGYVLPFVQVTGGFGYSDVYIDNVEIYVLDKDQIYSGKFLGLK